MLWVNIDVEIADACRGPRRSEDLVLHVLGVVSFGLASSGVGIQNAMLVAEDTVQSRHSESSSTDHHQDDQGNPQPPQNPENRNSPSTRFRSRRHVCRSYVQL